MNEEKKNEEVTEEEDGYGIVYIDDVPIGLLEAMEFGEVGETVPLEVMLLSRSDIEKLKSGEFPMIRNLEDLEAVKDDLSPEDYEVIKNTIEEMESQMKTEGDVIQFEPPKENKDD
jgi:hypothetical protein